MKMIRLFNEPRPIKEIIEQMINDLKIKPKPTQSHNEFFEPK